MSRYLSVRRVSLPLLVCLLAGTQLGPMFDFSTHADARSAAVQDVSCAPTPLGPASPYNAFILGDATQSSADAEGLVAVGGNATFTDYSVGSTFSVTVPYTTVLTVGGGLTFVRGAIGGNAVYGTTATVSQATVKGTVSQGSPLDFRAVGSSLLSLSDSYARQPANGAAVYNPTDGNYTLTSRATGLTVFSIDGTIPNSGIFRITGNDDGQGDQTFLINVSGASNQLVNLGFAETGISPSHVLFNFQAATALTISGNYVPASVLAPRAAVDFTNGALEGTLVAASLSGTGPSASGQLNSGQLNSGQFNQPPFAGCLPSPGGGPAPSPIPTTAPSSTAVPASTTTGTAVATQTMTPASTGTTAAATATPTNTTVATATPTNTTVATATPTNTTVATATPTNTATGTAMSTPTVPPASTGTSAAATALPTNAGGSVATSTGTSTPLNLATVGMATATAIVTTTGGGGGGGARPGAVRIPTSTVTPIKAGVAKPRAKPQSKPQTKVRYVTRVVTKTKTVIVYKTVTRYKYVTVTKTVTKVQQRTVVNHKTVITYKQVVKPVTRVRYRVVTVVHNVTKITQVQGLRVVRHPVTGRFAGPQQAWHGAIPLVEARIGIARLGISWAPVWARDYISAGGNAFTYDIVPYYGVTRFASSAGFGQRGLSMISGHDDEYGQIFKNLGAVRPGNAVVVTKGPHIYRYIVTSVRVVTPDDVAMLNATYTQPTLALISCTPYMVDTHRVVVIAQMQG